MEKVYKEEEILEISEANSKLIFQPKFIPFYPELLELGLTYIECLLYGFIDFYLKAEDKFYFTNEQLADIFKCGERTITGALSNLEKVNLIQNKYKQRSNGGKIRFIQLAESATGHKQKSAISSSRICQKYINNINNNKIDSSKEESNIYSPNEENDDLNSLQLVGEKEHPQAPVVVDDIMEDDVKKLGFYDYNDLYVQSMMKNKNFNKNNLDALSKLNKLGYSYETISTVSDFIRQDQFWSQQIRSLPKLLKKNPDGVRYIDVMIDKIRQWKPNVVHIEEF